MANRHRTPEEVTINLTPMIDVVFLLVIFFMVGAKFSESESRVDVSVASSGPVNSLSRGPDERKVEVTADGGILLDGQVVTLSQLAATLTAQRESYPDLKVAVRSDGGVEYTRVHQVMRAVDQSGVQNFNVAETRGSAGGGGLRR